MGSLLMGINKSSLSRVSSLVSEVNVGLFRPSGDFSCLLRVPGYFLVLLLGFLVGSLSNLGLEGLFLNFDSLSLAYRVLFVILTAFLVTPLLLVATFWSLSQLFGVCREFC